MVRISALAIFMLALSCPVSLARAATTPQHVLTADFFGPPYGSTTIAPSEAAPYLTWAQVGIRDATAVAASGIKTQYYIDPGLTIANRGDQMYTSDETTFAHDCFGGRISVPYDSLTEYLMAVEQPSMRAVFARWVDRITSVAHYDALFEDDGNPPSEYLRFRPMPCGYSDAGWLRALDSLNHASPIPVIINGLNASKRPLPSALIGLLSSDKTLGLNYESCYSSATQRKMTGTIWEAMENSELLVAAARKLFQCTARDGAAATASTDQRLFVYASFLLSYDPATSVIWEDYATPSKFRVEPESELVALEPLGITPSDVSGLQVVGGTYARRFRRCYIRGQFVGPCAAVVNPDSSKHAFPYHEYNHTLVLHGGGVLDGGTIAVNGPPPASQLGPVEAVLAFR